MNSDTSRGLEEDQSLVEPEIDLDDALEEDDEDESTAIDSSLLSIAMFAGLVLFAAGCYLMGWWG